MILKICTQKDKIFLTYTYLVSKYNNVKFNTSTAFVHELFIAAVTRSSNTCRTLL